MLELRPNCEWCDRDLPPSSPDACICSYECTYCRTCVDEVLHGVCATCGGNLVSRPIRPKTSHRPELRLGLRHHPASPKRVNSEWTMAEVAEMSARLRNVAPEDR